MKAMLALGLLALMQSCGGGPEKPKAAASALTSYAFLTESFTAARQENVRYDETGRWLQQVTLRFETVDDPAALRLAIQSRLIDHLTQKEHPEGSCVQVKHLRRVSEDVFEVLVVCVG